MSCSSRLDKSRRPFLPLPSSVPLSKGGVSLAPSISLSFPIAFAFACTFRRASRFGLGSGSRRLALVPAVCFAVPVLATQSTHRRTSPPARQTHGPCPSTCLSCPLPTALALMSTPDEASLGFDAASDAASDACLASSSRFLANAYSSLAFSELSSTFASSSAFSLTSTSSMLKVAFEVAIDGFFSRPLIRWRSTLLATLEEANTLASVEQLRTTRALSTMYHALTTATSESNKDPLPCNCKVTNCSCFADVWSNPHNHFHKYQTQYPNSSHRVHHTVWLMQYAAGVQTHALSCHT